MTQVKKIAVFKGDYIGPEIMAAGLKVLAAVTEKSAFDYTLLDLPFGGDGIDRVGEPLPQQTIQTAQQADAILLSAIGGPKWDQAPCRPEQGLLAIRAALGLYANIRPTQVLSEQMARSPLKAAVVAQTDFVIVRELTSGAYFGKPRVLTEDFAKDTMYYSAAEVRRIMHVGFKLAQKRRRHVTIVDKSNVLATSKLWRQVAKEVAADYPDVTVAYTYVDAMAMAIIAKPATFDVVITPNLFGDILSDEAAQITGSIGQIPSVSIGTTGPNLYEPIHGSAPDIAGQGIANPISMIHTVAMMLETSFGEVQLAQQIKTAVAASVKAQVMTPDMGGHATTTTVTDYIIAAIKSQHLEVVK